MKHTNPVAMSAAANHVSREYGETGYVLALEEAWFTAGAVFNVRHADGSEFRLVADRYGNVRRLPDAESMGIALELDAEAIRKGRAWLIAHRNKLDVTGYDFSICDKRTAEDHVNAMEIATVAYYVGKHYPLGWERFISPGEAEGLYDTRTPDELCVEAV